MKELIKEYTKLFCEYNQKEYDKQAENHFYMFYVIRAKYTEQELKDLISSQAIKNVKKQYNLEKSKRWKYVIEEGFKWNVNKINGQKVRNLYYDNNIEVDISDDLNNFIVLLPNNKDGLYYKFSYDKEVIEDTCTEMVRSFHLRGLL